MSRIKENWIEKKPMREARSHFASAIYNGRIYCFGGGGDGFKSLNSVESYSPADNCWDTAAPMPTIRSGLVAATLGNEIYLVGGGFKNQDGKFSFFKTVEIYSPEKDSWRQGPDMLLAHDYPGVAVAGGEIYIIGGHNPECTGGPLVDPGLDACEIYNQNSGRWRYGPALNVPRFAMATVVCDDLIYTLGGCRFSTESNEFKNLNTVEILKEKSASGCAGWTENARLTLPWNGAGCGACTDNSNIFLIGGNTGALIVASVACYNPEHGKWLHLPPIDRPRIVMAAYCLDNSIIIIGGRASDKKTVIPTVIEYFPDIPNR